LEEEFAKFVADARPSEEEVVFIPAIKSFFKAYVTSGSVRDIIESRRYTELATNPLFSSQDFKAVPAKYRALVPEYVKDYVPLNAFIA
jgi:type I restriction enzyme R subunit